METARRYKKWGMPFAIIGLIIAVLGFANAITYLLYVAATSSLPYDAAASHMMEIVATVMMAYAGFSAFFGFTFAILGIVGWSKKKMSVTAIVFSVLTFIFFITMLMFYLGVATYR